MDTENGRGNSLPEGRKKPVIDQMTELAAQAADHPTPQLPRPRIVIYGAPVRGIAPCGSCHGSLDNKTGSPWLEGLSEAYMKAQLQAFASGRRNNDISQQMRNVARAMTPQEIDGPRPIMLRSRPKSSRRRIDSYVPARNFVKNSRRHRRTARRGCRPLDTGG